MPLFITLITRANHHMLVYLCFLAHLPLQSWKFLTIIIRVCVFNKCSKGSFHLFMIPSLLPVRSPYMSLHNIVLGWNPLFLITYSLIKFSCASSLFTFFHPFKSILYKHSFFPKKIIYGIGSLTQSMIAYLKVQIRRKILNYHIFVVT